MDKFTVTEEKFSDSPSPEEPVVCDWRVWSEPELITLHRQESAIAFEKFDKKAIQIVRGLADYSYRPQPVFNGKRAVARRKLKTETALESLMNLVGNTSQEILYSSDPAIGGLLKDLQKGDTIVTATESKAFANPNKAITGIKYTRAAAVIHGLEHALPVPFHLSGMESMYLLASGTELVVEDIRKESWKCHPLISCAREYKDISVYHLHAKG